MLFKEKNLEFSEKDEKIEKIEEKVRETLTRLKEMPIIQEAFRVLDKLPDNLVYHNNKHTEDALHEAVFFATADKLPDREIELLGIAAVYHDAGFIKTPKANEPIGAKMAKEAMTREGGYTPEEIQMVVEAIEDTAVNFDPEKGLNQ